MTNGNLWRFLVIDDRQADEIEEFVAGNNVLEIPDWVIVEKCTEFKEALNLLNEKRFDLVILDLKDDSITLEEEDKPLAGEIVFDQICKSRFVPVIFYTAYPTKVEDQENPYARVVDRTDPRELRTAIKEVFNTRLPQLIRFIENEQRDYLWEHVRTLWQKTKSPYDKIDLSYLLARRLANTLGRRSIRRFLAKYYTGGPQETEETIHPIEMYVYPPTNPDLLAGDILKDNFNKRNGYWMVLTPSCYLEQGKATYVVLAACACLSVQSEFEKVKEYVSKGQDPSGNVSDDLKDLISNNRKGKGIQRERYYFLPETFFIPDLVVDFQNIIRVPVKKIKKGYDRIASLDSPFAEACLAKFSQYYGRLGTPDIDKDFVCKRIVESIKKEIEK